ncbi:MAG: cell envelope integrity protein CreD, partial [Opitutales bacterium]
MTTAWQSLRSSLTFKLLAIAFLVIGLLLMTIPLFIIIDEREERREGVTREISAKWGLDQTIIGPILTVPYKKTLTRILENKEKTYQEIRYLHLLPETLEVNGSVEPETRYRGIYEAVVYKSHLRLTGNFPAPDWAITNVEEEEIQKDKAWLTIGISDTRGIRDSTTITLAEQHLEPMPGLPTQEVITSGIRAKVDLSDANGSREFSIDLHLDGSSSLAFSPLGKTTSVSVKSTWPSPSFDGAFLPLDKEVTEKGFSASWKVLHLNRPIPQAWTGDATTSNGQEAWNENSYDGFRDGNTPRFSFAGPENVLGNSVFGIRFYLPTDVYQKSTRMAKYAILFLCFAFAAFFFSEILQKARVHPIQYLLVGFAILVFYLLLLSFSEHFGFDAAYGLSTAAVVALVAGYARAILRSGRLGATVGAVLVVLYGYLYVILQLESYALLMGS